MKKRETIFLVGMPGSGKSTFGKALASHLGFPFIDTDALIEQKEGRSIPAIFTEKGEAYFREVEREVLLGIAPEKAVVATGGGMPCFFDNMEIINQKGLSVFLDVPADVLVTRVMKQGNRPLLPHKEVEELSRAVTAKREKRISHYKQAAIALTYPQISVEGFMRKVAHY